MKSQRKQDLKNNNDKPAGEIPAENNSKNWAVRFFGQGTPRQMS